MSDASELVRTISEFIRPFLDWYHLGILVIVLVVFNFALIKSRRSSRSDAVQLELKSKRAANITITGDVSGGDLNVVLTGDTPLPFDIQTVFFGTNRGLGKSTERLDYTDERTDVLKTGRAYISVPKKRKIGKVNRPLSLVFAGFRLWEQEESPEKHFSVLKIEELSSSKLQELSAIELEESDRFKSSAFLFVHGFNVTFDNALYRAAQLSHDLNFDGPAFMFSWPAVGTVSNYATDMDSAALAAPHLDDFIDIILKTENVEKLHLVVHSMGNAALAEMMKTVGTKLASRKGKTIDQLILAAPDIDVGIFNQIAHHFTNYANGVTLYACNTDRALLLSKKLRNDYPRAGDVSNEGPAIFPEIDTIDVSAVGTSLFALNHSVYAEDRGVLDDLGQLMLKGERPPPQRMPTLKSKTNARGTYWVMPA